jgi:carbonic anhydrase/acetyltransferase-like protein (isoleucine patch superfamily)
LNGARIGRNCLVAANALVSENTIVPDNSLVRGIPAKVAACRGEVLHVVARLRRGMQIVS